MKKYLLLFLAMTTAAIASSIEGQVFIVTKGGQNVKLGLVTVGVYPRAVVEKFVTEKKALSLPVFDQLEQEWKDHRKNQELLDARSRKEKPRAAMATSDESMRELKAGMVANKKILILLISFFEDFPNTGAIAKTKSDADGKFKLEGNFGEDVLLVAYSSRMVGEETETYTWVLPPGDWESPMFLSNDNLFSISGFEPIPELLSGNKAERKAFYLKAKKELQESKEKAAPVSTN